MVLQGEEKTTKPASSKWRGKLDTGVDIGTDVNEYAIIRVLACGRHECGSGEE